ncbi:MAG: FHA domain-containing protein [Gemmataceae bacterium]
MPPEIVLRGQSQPVKGQTWRSSGLLRIGWLDTMDVVLENHTVSRRHAEIQGTDRGWVVRDLGSRNGTRLNGVTIGAEPALLRGKDLIEVGSVVLLVEAVSNPSTALERLAASTTPEQWASTFFAMKLSMRKLRLFACACCRCEWQKFPAPAILLAERYLDVLGTEEDIQTAMSQGHDELTQVLKQVIGTRALDVADRHADELASNEELRRAHRMQLSYGTEMMQVATAPDPMQLIRHHLLGTLERLAQDRGSGPRRLPPDCPVSWRSKFFSILTEMVGPFYPLPAKVDPVWLAANGGVVKKLAKSIYNERRFDDMPILGDALEDAGCADAEILKHCREPGRHWRGCWVIDTLLGQE